MKSRRAIFLSIALIGMQGCGAAFAAPPEVQDIADAYNHGDISTFKQLFLSGGMAMTDRTHVVTSLSMDSFLSKIRGCEITNVIIAGENFQTADAIQWTCWDQSLKDEQCAVVSYTAELKRATRNADGQQGFVVSPLYLSSDYDSKKCGPMALPAPTRVN